ncbi:helicase-related protein [Oribacterium sp. FC2011]|uniref:helicase-related protein n=1 Tax=Oribacterium sp. FC2011 TaxID=1408311 RepID=UPI0004E13857|nr:helicase-related protein [Oribacterium sp. FC2011]
MAFSDYYNARDIITDIISKDLLGPVMDDEIIINERPLDYYILGKLYPADTEADLTLGMSSDDCGDLDEENSISLCNGRNPSSFGISIAVKPGASSFKISGKAARYVKTEFNSVQEKLGLQDTDDNRKKTYWRREQLPEVNTTINVNEIVVGKAKIISVSDGLEIRVLAHRIMKDGAKIITVTMTNTFSKCDDYKLESSYSFFQPSLVIYETEKNTIGELVYRVDMSTDEELVELNMLYHNVKNYASGHGCAVQVEEINGLKHICSRFLPTHEVKQMKPSTKFNSEILSMKFLSEATSKEIQDGLNLLVDEYDNWIKEQKKTILDLQKEYRLAAEKNISKCLRTSERIKKSIHYLDDIKVYQAFTLANKAMFQQRKDMLIRTNKFESDEKIRWYPFQLAFFVQEICSFADPKGEERKNVDLLWFPTGGGKTEAYLGIAAFVIFLRRLTKGDKGNGVTVLMRYTMRLLTFQQFERASALICACEVLRRNENIPGGEIGIGLWAGQALTPNKIEDAEKILNGDEPGDIGYEIGNPVQLSRCPHCGAPITSNNYSCDKSKKRMIIKCSSNKCAFKEGLPVYLIDEEIYHYTPTYIVATVDKFAQIALKEECGSLFGINTKNTPPELIIQDELHLISGPLGTITGLYEAAIRKLCENEGINVKIIASTATIRNAKDQILGLYASEYTQFPPQAININDSFFAVLSEKDEKPAREYLGCMGIGTSPTTMMIRVMASLLFATRYLSEQDNYTDDIIDAYWTITSYFNTLRELGGAIIRVIDDIQDRYIYLQNTKFVKKYPMKVLNQRYTKYKELTSREKSEDIGKVVQEELPIPFKRDKSTHPYEFVLSSNMISVGVDVGRLGCMVVVGQPKTTSEYIQATSRVGRENPGLVITTYNQARSRDRSHYETFYQYHASFYKYVEATSITPFSDRARDRALQTLYVILCRYTVPELFGNNDAINYSRNLPGVEKVRKYIFDYVGIVDPDELENVKYEISEIEEEWECRRSHQDKFVYRPGKYIKNNESLFDADYEEDSRFRVLNTMRSVETNVLVTTKE